MAVLEFTDAWRVGTRKKNAQPHQGGPLPRERHADHQRVLGGRAFRPARTRRRGKKGVGRLEVRLTRGVVRLRVGIVARIRETVALRAGVVVLARPAPAEMDRPLLLELI